MKYIPRANSLFVRSLNKWIWCGFQSKAKIEPRYSTAKSNVSYKETPAKKDFSFLTPRSASFKIYFLCEFTWCPFKTGEKAFNFKSYRIPNLQFYLFAVDSNHSSSKFNTWTKIKKYIYLNYEHAKKNLEVYVEIHLSWSINSMPVAAFRHTSRHFSTQTYLS